MPKGSAPLATSTAIFYNHAHENSHQARRAFVHDQPEVGRIEDAVDLAEPPIQFSERRLVVVDSRQFFRECIKKSIESALAIPVLALSSISELADLHTGNRFIRLLMLFLSESGSEENAQALSVVSEFSFSVPTVILSSRHDMQMMRAVMAHGAKAYIPMTMGFEIVVEAVRFVLAGGTYVPPEYLLAAAPAAQPTQQPIGGGITARELAVVKAIQQGKPNKIIAYELNMCESTVKVHVRRVMKKMRAKNRTNVAMKATDLLSCKGCLNQNECWAAVRCLRKSV